MSTATLLFNATQATQRR